MGDPPLRPASINRCLAALKTAFSNAVLNGKVSRNPVKEIKLAKENNLRVRYLTPDEESRLSKVLPEKYHLLVLVALHTGMRKTKKFSVEWREVDCVQGQVKVRLFKSGNSRIIAMNKTVTEALRYLSKVRLIKNSYVFPGEKPVARRTDLPRYWEQDLQAAGIENFHWRDLRHTFASRLGRSRLGFRQGIVRTPRLPNDSTVWPRFARTPKYNSWGFGCRTRIRISTREGSKFVSWWS